MDMKNSPKSCPSGPALSRYAVGEIVGPEFDEFDQHISSCRRCQRSLETLRQHSDDLTRIIPEAIQRPAASIGLELQKSLEKINGKPVEDYLHRKTSQSSKSVTFIRNYQIVESIGEGGMGRVYRAVDARHNRHVAIKVLRQDRVNSDEAVSRFYREMKILEQLKHPNIVEALEAGEQDGLQFMVMEYLAGVDVGQLCQRIGPLPLADACEIVRLAALALQQAHEQNILHRDVKPSNLRLTPDGVLKLLDLGLAHFCDFSQPALSRSDQALGTLAYMAPEQFSREEDVTVRSDIFSLGVTFHEILSGQRPLERPGHAPLLADLSSVRPDIDTTLLALIRDMTSVASNGRPSSMSDVANRVQPYTSSSDLASLVAQYFNWNSKKTPPNGAVVAPPIMVDAVTAAVSQTDIQSPRPLKLADLESPATAQRSGSSGLPGRTIGYWAVGVLTAALCLTIAFSKYYPWPKPDEGIRVEAPPVVIPPAEETGELELLPEGEIAEQLLADGGVLATNLQSQETTMLVSGANSLKPGTYTITIDGPEDFRTHDNIRIVADAKRKHRLTTSLTKPFAYPTIPDEVGTFAVYKGTLWHVGWPEKKELAFQLKLQVLSTEELVGKPKFVWLKIDATTQHAVSAYTETGYLKINLERWNIETFLEIEEGYVRASGGMISPLVEQQTPNSKDNGLIVPFAKDRDWLLEIAPHAMPEHRLSLHDFLALFFGDDSIRAATETIRELRPRLLTSGNRNSWIESFQDSFGGGVPCYVASSRQRETDRQALGYLMARAKSEPFGFVRMEARMPSLRATCAITSSGPIKVDKNELLLVQRNCIDPKDSPERRQFWSIVALPTKIGETVWHGSIETGHGFKEFVEITARTHGAETVNNRQHRWISLEISSILDSGEDVHWEAAHLLVDEEEYQNFGRFRAKRGWLSYSNNKTVFSLPEDGDLSAIREHRMMLFDSPNLKRFGVVDCLALLFDAEFTPNSEFTIVRKEIALESIGFSATRSSVPITLESSPAVQGELWGYPAANTFEQKIRRSPHILFDVVDLTLRKDSTKVSLAIKSTNVPNSENTAGSLAVAVFEDRSQLTQGRIETLQSPNWRIWTWIDSGKTYRAWAEFGGTIGVGAIDNRQKREVLLRARDGQEIIVPCTNLVDADWDWAQKGRVWKDSKGNQTPQYNLVEDTGEHIVLQMFNGDRIRRIFESLPNDEKNWVESLRLAKKRKGAANEQTDKWLKFAAEIRSTN